MAVLCGTILLYDPCGIIYTKTAKHRRRTKREKTENPKPPPEMHGRSMLMNMNMNSTMRLISKGCLKV